MRRKEEFEEAIEGSTEEALRVKEASEDGSPDTQQQ